MEEDASLDRFVGDGSADESDSEEDDSGVTTDEPTTETDSNAVATAEVDPAEPTYRVTPSAEPCSACATEVTRLWRDGERFVCGDCKDW